MKNPNPILLIDYYKAAHYLHQSALGTETVYSTWTARSNKHHDGCPETVVFGHQAFVKEYFIEFWKENFFDISIEKLRNEYLENMQNCFNPIYADFSRFEKLHKLGYLPIEVWSVPEGIVLPINIPQCAMWNTNPDFGWLPQYLEDMWSCHNYLPSTSATTSYYRRKDLVPFYEKSCDDPSLVRRACGDFSLRGMTGEQAAYASGLGHLLSFTGTATVDTNGYAKQYYFADIKNKPVGIGTPSLEHSVVCQGIAYYTDLYLKGGLDYELLEVARRAGDDWDVSLIAEMVYLYSLITRIQPTGILSYVSDTNDYWGVITKVLPALRKEILSRDGKLVVRPDSGDPYSIVNGDPFAETLPERVGTLELLREIFGAHINKKGYLVLDPHIGLIYGDAITRQRAIDITEGMLLTGFSAENIIYGIGAYTFQYVTRDTRGYAIKATAAVFKRMGNLPLSKAPKTDLAKKSPKGAVVVYRNALGYIEMEDGHTIYSAKQAKDQLLRPIFRDGALMNQDSIYKIRERLWGKEF